MQSMQQLKTIPDDELLRGLVTLLRRSRDTEAELVGHIGEADARRLYAREASPSMFAYCTERLHLSDAEGGGHSVDAISLQCAAHNSYLAEVDYGRAAMVRHRGTRTGSRSPGLRT